MKQCPKCKSYDVCIRGVNTTLHYSCVSCGNTWNFEGANDIVELKNHLKHKHKLRQLTFDDLVNVVIELCSALEKKK